MLCSACSSSTWASRSRRSRSATRPAPISILSDGFHSLTDAASNVVGLVGVRAAERPPDEDHPYGHRKYETVAAAAVTVFLLLVMIEVLRNAFNHLTGPIGGS